MPDPRSWNVSPSDRARSYACERYAGPGHQLLLRAVDVGAEPATVFRWVCQLRAAPYSYDLVDHLGRRSPRRLTPGLDELAIGQRFAVVARIVEFERDRQVTALTPSTRLFGKVALTYDVRSTEHGSRLVGALTVEAVTAVQRVRRSALAWGDLVMMRKQLLTLKELAEG